MRRRAPANVEAGSSLFTFLDGLICTMGALIVVLVVMVHQGKMSVQAALEAVFPSAEDASEIRRSDLEWRIGLMRESRDKTLAQLDDARQALAHLEDHARRLRSQLEEQDLAHDEFQRTVSGEEREHEQLQAQVARAKDRIAAARSELDEKLHSVGTHTDSYAIIPYHGNNQTRRRPIYIECGSAGVVFQPEGIVLTEEDFAGDLGPSNPLASGLRAAREHMIRTRGSKPGDDGMPYPLLLVRPDGIGAYLAARAAMGSWSTEFGYELIDQDWPIEFPPADPDMTMAIRQAITEGRLKQAYLARNAPLLRSHGERPSFGPSSGGGGLTRADGSPMGSTSSRDGNRSRSSRPALAGKGYQGDGGPGGRDTSRPKRRPGQGGGTGAPGDGSLLGPRYSSSQGNDGGDGQGGDGKGGNGISPYAAALQSLSQGTGGSGAGGSAAGGQNGNGAPDQGGGGAPGSGLGAGGQDRRPGSSNGGPARGIGQFAGGGDGAGGDVVKSGMQGTNLRGQGAVRDQGGKGQGAGGPAGRPGSPNGGSARGIGQIAGGGDGAGGVDQSGTPGLRGQGGNGQGAGGQGGKAGSPNGGSARGTGQVAGGGDGSSGMDQSGTPGSSIGTQRGEDGGPDGNGPSGSGQSRGRSNALNGGGVPSTGTFAGGNGGGTGNGGGSLAGNGSGGGGQGGKPGTASGRSAAGTSQLASGDDGTGGTEPSGTQDTADPKSAIQDPKTTLVPPEQPLPNSPGPHARYGYGSSPTGVADAGAGSGNDAQGDSGTSGGGPSSTTGGASGNASSSSQSRSGNQSSRTTKASTRTGGSGSSSSSGSNSSSASSSNPGTSGGGTSGGASQPGQAGGLPMPNMTFGEQPQSIAQHRGKNWANQSANDERAKEAIVPVKMICDADHLSLVPERGSGQEMRIIKFSPRTSDSVNELVDAVWDQVDSWGTAGRGNYWRPKLVLVIEPGGEQRFEDLKSLLKESGFDIEGRPRTPQKKKRPSSAKSQWPSPFRARPRAATPD